MVNWVELDRQRLVDKPILMYKIVNNMVPDDLSLHFVFRSDTLTYIGTSRLLLHSPVLIIVKEVCHTAELFYGIVYPWILVSHFQHVVRRGDLGNHQAYISLDEFKSKLKNYDFDGRFT